MTIAFTILLAIFLAENICLGFWLYTRPDRAARQSEKDKFKFLREIALKTANRNYIIQGAPPLDDEFEEPETSAKKEYSNEDLDALGAEEAQLALQDIEDELAGAQKRRSQGSIARRRELVGQAARLEARIADGIAPKNLVHSETPFVGTLEPQDEEHLSQLKPN